jgi:hypothetical protein
MKIFRRRKISKLNRKTSLLKKSLVPKMGLIDYMKVDWKKLLKESLVPKMGLIDYVKVDWKKLLKKSLKLLKNL